MPPYSVPSLTTSVDDVGFETCYQQECAVKKKRLADGPNECKLNCCYVPSVPFQTTATDNTVLIKTKITYALSGCLVQAVQLGSVL